jgi:hypothetical protein
VVSGKEEEYKLGYEESFVPSEQPTQSELENSLQKAQDTYRNKMEDQLRQEFESWCGVFGLSTKRIEGTGGKWEGRYYQSETEAAWQCLCEFKLPPKESDKLLFKNQKGISACEPEAYA